jgi:hypothetical protein
MMRNQLNRMRFLLKGRRFAPIFGLAITLGLTCLSASAEENAYIKLGEECGLFKCERREEIPNGANLIYSRDPYGKNGSIMRIISGPAASIVAEGYRAQAETERLNAEARARAAATRLSLRPPPRARVLEIRNDSSELLGGIYEIPGGSGVLLASRHLFQQADAAKLATSLNQAFATAQLALENYQIFGLERGTQVLDAVALIPVSLVNKLPSDRSGRPTLEALNELAASTESGDIWASWQLGSIEGAEPETSAEVNQQFSYGVISRLSVSQIWLDLSALNHTSPGSSGSLVWTAPRPADSTAALDWKVGGVAECIMPGGADRNGVRTNGAVRVIPFSLLTSSSLMPVTLNELASEPSLRHRPCVPIDRRAGGGWRTDGGGQ